jgi:hypothetical protein
VWRERVYEPWQEEEILQEVEAYQGVDRQGAHCKEDEPAYGAWRKRYCKEVRGAVYVRMAGRRVRARRLQRQMHDTSVSS